jgi:hypothetical protein
LRADDVIRTGGDGIAAIEFFDGSVTRLDHDTTLTLERVANIPKAPESRLIEMNLERGRTFHDVRHVSDPQSHFQVAGGGAVVAAGEASFVINALPIGGVALWVLPDAAPSGSVEIDVPEGIDLRVQEGEGTTVSEAGNAGTPFRLSQDHVSDPWVTYNLCELNQADVELCHQAAEPATPEPQPQPEPATNVLSKKVEPVSVTPVTLEAPAVAVLARALLVGAPRAASDERRALFRFDSPDPLQYFECALDGGSFRPCTSPQRFRGLSDGTHLFLVRAVDPGGNPGPVVRRRWRIDTVAPETLITSPSLAPGGSQALFQFVSSETRSRFQCGLDAGPFLTCASPKNYAGLGPGTHTFRVRAVDRAGNVDPSPAAFSWTVDGVVVVPVPLVAGGEATSTGSPGSAGVVWEPSKPSVAGTAGDRNGSAGTAEPVPSIGVPVPAVVSSAVNDAAEQASSLLPPVETKEVIVQSGGDLPLDSSLIGT